MSGRRLALSLAIALAMACSEDRVPSAPTPMPSPSPNPNPGPVVVNSAPVIGAMRVQGPRRNQPPNFADLAEEIDVSATVTDAESQVSGLQFNWSAAVGTFTGSGPTVKWRAPGAATTPLTVTVNLEVVESYVSQGRTLENRVTSTTTLMLHDSVKEVTDVARQFLLDFSDSNLSADHVMRNFQAGCHGTAAELSEVEENRRNFTIVEYEMGPAITAVNFGSMCAWRSRRGDACSRIPMEWRSRAKRNLLNSSGAVVVRSGEIQDVRGVDQLTAVYDRQVKVWKLCDSDWDSGARSLEDSEIRGLVP
jgi:polyisoprenoid-binding protein YceI